MRFDPSNLDYAYVCEIVGNLHIKLDYLQKAFSQKEAHLNTKISKLTSDLESLSQRLTQENKNEEE
tara:strand:+ start:1065 stop:1262 length:198 start_codon:yes stop_codon:yes gene_type:complete